jgi:hypothetical protein
VALTDNEAQRHGRSFFQYTSNRPGSSAEPP